MRKRFRHLSPQEAELADQDLLHDPVASFPRSDLLTIQFCKVINYFRTDASYEWGGTVGLEVLSDAQDQCSRARAEQGYQRFLEDVDAFGGEELPKWLHKKLDSLPWGPDNFRLRTSPSPSLGYPYEPYLSCHGGILTCYQASRILSIEWLELVQLKMSVLLDEAVIDMAAVRMLNPRAEWPRIRLQSGGRGRTYRFNEER